MRSDFYERKEARAERYQNLSEKAKKESESRYNQANKLSNMIPFGQPILVGHHSEKQKSNATLPGVSLFWQRRAF